MPYFRPVLKFKFGIGSRQCLGKNICNIRVVSRISEKVTKHCSKWMYAARANVLTIGVTGRLTQEGTDSGCW